MMCPKCGTELPANAPAGVCPKCLMLAALEGESDVHIGPPTSAPTTPHSRGFIPPEPAALAEHFQQLEILELLGHGGMGAVYKARQRGLDRLVALKILPLEVGGDPAFAERFSREARALALLSHANIVGVYDSGKADDLYYLTMEYIDGVNLRQAMQAGTISPEEAIAIVPQICDALQYAHDEGIVHRDIKPENVLVDAKGRVKIADFGLAKLLRHEPTDLTLTQAQQIMGTPRYMAPEQMAGSANVDHRADIYSLGVVFYELLTGEVPMGRFDPPSKRVQIDVRLDEVVLRTLDREPDKRYQRASEIKTDMETIATSKAVSPREAVTGYPELPSAPDRLFARRMLWIIGFFWIIWAGMWVFDLFSYVTAAQWYFEDGFPKQPWNVALVVSSAMLGYFLVYWWYSLAKLPGVPRSFGDFMKTVQSPDRRTRRFFLPAGIYAAVFAATIGTAMALAGDSVQASLMYAFLVAAPVVFVASSLWIYGLPQGGVDALQQSSAAALSRKPEDKSGKWSGKPLTQIRFTVDGDCDLLPQAVFHFSSLGYEVIEQSSDVCIFQRGGALGALGSMDIREYPTRLTVRTAPVAHEKLWVSCDWSVRTMGAWITKRDIRKLETEGRHFQAILGGTAADSPAVGRSKTGASPSELDPATARSQVKIPAIGLIVVGVLTLLTVPLSVLAAASVWAVTPASRGGSHMEAPRPTVEEYPAEPLGVSPNNAIPSLPGDVLDEASEPLEVPADKVVSPIRDELQRSGEVESQVRSGDAQTVSAAPASWLIVAMILSLVLVGLPSLVIGGLIVAGGWKMLSLHGYGLAVTASILALLPCQPLFILGWVFGIWALVVLRREDVMAVFGQQSDAKKPETAAASFVLLS